MPARVQRTSLQRGRFESGVAVARSVAVAGGRSVSVGRALGGVARPAAATRPLLRVVAGGIERIPSASAAEPLARGRALIVLAAVLGAGLIYINVGKLQAGDGYSAYAAQSLTLQRENTRLRAVIANRSSSERIQKLARDLGMMMPQPEQFKYVNGKSGNRVSLKAVRGYDPPTKDPPAVVTPVTPVETTAPVANDQTPVEPSGATTPVQAPVTTPAAGAPAAGGAETGANGGTAVQGQAGGQ